MRFSGFILGLLVAWAGAIQPASAANEMVIAEINAAIAAQPGFSQTQQQILSKAVTDTLATAKTLAPDKQQTAKEQIKPELENVARLADLCSPEQFRVKSDGFIWDLQMYVSLPAVTPADREKDEQLRQIARQALGSYILRAYVDVPSEVRATLVVESIAEFDRNVHVGSYFTYQYLYPPANLPSVEQLIDRLMRKTSANTATAYRRFMDRIGDQLEVSAAQKSFVQSVRAEPHKVMQSALGDLMLIPIRARMNLPSAPQGLLASQIKLQFELEARLARQIQEAETEKIVSTTLPATRP